MKSLQDLNPESYVGKLSLLALDKLAIGAVMAFALVAYDQCRVKQERQYHDAQRRVDLEFKRAEYVRDLVPMALDAAQGVQIRAQAWRSLVETQSISTSSAIGIAAALLSSELPEEGSTEEEFFVETLLQEMPAGIPVILRQYSEMPAKSLWSLLLIEAMSRLPDSDLSVLDDVTFLQANLATMEMAVVPYLSLPSAAEWFTRSAKGVKLLGAMYLAHDQMNTPTVDYDRYASERITAVRFIADLMSPSSNEDRQGLATALIHILRDYPTYPELAAVALDVVLEVPFEHRTMKDRTVSDRYGTAAGAYLARSGASPTVFVEIEGRILDTLEEMYALVYGTTYDDLRQLPRTELSKQAYVVGFLASASAVARRWGLTELTEAEAGMYDLLLGPHGPTESAERTTGEGDGSTAPQWWSDRSAQTLEDWFGLEEKKLALLGLREHAQDWRSHR